MCTVFYSFKDNHMYYLFIKGLYLGSWYRHHLIHVETELEVKYVVQGQGSV